MYLLLSFFLLPKAASAVTDPRPPVLGIGRPALILALFFAALQWVPALYPGKSAITGEGRMFALHMFDAPLECRSERIVHNPDGSNTSSLIRPRFVYQRIACDPLVYFQLATASCRAVHQEEGTDFDLRLKTRQGSGPYYSVIDIKNFCASDTSYRWWEHNAWISTQSSDTPD